LGGSFRPLDGPAAGVLFTDIGVIDREPVDGDPANEVTVQRIPDGVGAWTVTTDGGLGRDGTPGTWNAVPLPAPYGSCCLPNGACLSSLESARCVVAGGWYRGDATSCLDPCPSLIGACCLPNGNCEQTTGDQCAGEGGTFHGVDTFCLVVPPCPQPPPGACCLLGGSCVHEDEYDCRQVSGDFRGIWTTCGQPGGECGGPVSFKINEVYRNDDETDDVEFIELAGPGGTDLDDYAVVEIEGDRSDAGQEGKIDGLWSLTGMVMPGDGFLVLGDAAVRNVDIILGGTNQLENGTATFLLIAGYDFAMYPRTTDIDVDNDGVVDSGITLGTVIDGLAFEDGDNDGAASPDRVYFDVVAVGPNGSVAPAGVARVADGYDTESPDDFCELGEAGDGSDGLAVPTPGRGNDCRGCLVPGDATGDGVLGLRDYGVMQCCFGEGGASPAWNDCRCLDMDSNVMISLIDYAIFLVSAGLTPR